MQGNFDGEHVLTARHAGRACYARPSAALALATLVVVALVVLARRWAGALASSLGPAALLTTGALTAAAAVAIRLSWFLDPEAQRALWRDRAVMLLTSLALLALGAGLSVPGTPGVAKFLLFTLLAVEEGWAWAWYLCRRNGPPRQPTAACSPRAREQYMGRAAHNSHADEPPPQEVVQQLVRSQAADGSESLSGWLRIAFAAGQRTGSVHVAFCPPFGATPELLVEHSGGPETLVKTAQLLPYGVRLDLKLVTAADEPTSVLLQFVAQTAQM